MNMLLCTLIFLLLEKKIFWVDMQLLRKGKQGAALKFTLEQIHQFIFMYTHQHTYICTHIYTHRHTHIHIKTHSPRWVDVYSIAK